MEDTKFGKMNFNIRKIIPGEEATPSTFNRPLLGAIDSDSKLGEAISFTDRSMGLVATEKTSFLGHFDKGLATEIIDVPYTQVGQVDYCFNSDGKYKGQFWSFNTSGNLFGSDGSIDSSLKSLKGWVTTGNEIGQCIIRSTNIGTQFRNYLRGGSSGAGTLSITTGVDIDVSALTKKVLSLSLKVFSNCDLDTSKASLEFGIDQLNASNAVVVTSKVILNKKFDTVNLKLENIKLDTTCTKIRPFIKVLFKGAKSLIDITMKDFMINNAEYVGGYSQSLNLGSGVLYNDCISTSEEQGTILIKGCLNYEYNKVAANKYGPLFLIDSVNNKGFGLVAELGTLTLYELNLANMATIQKGNSIIVDTNDFDEYTIFSIRFGKTKGEVQGSFIDSTGLVHTSSLPYPTSYQDKMLSIGLGQFNNNVANFEGPLTELRYDREWLNDQQLMTMSLSKIPFINFNDVSLSTDDVHNILDSIGVNLLPNPDGRLWLNHWSGLPGESIFTNVIGHPIIGSGFKWVGGYAMYAYAIESQFMQIDPTQPCRLRCKMISASGASGKFGIGIQYYKSKSAVTGTLVKVYANNSGYNDYYSCVDTTPSDAMYAKVILIVDPRFNATEAYWSKIKFEQGPDFTMFSDDVSPKYAVYA